MSATQHLQHLLERRVHADPAHLSSLRSDFGVWLGGEGAPQTEIEDWQLILSELAANACSACPEGCDIEIRATCAAGRIVLRVMNSSTVPRLPRIPVAVDHAVSSPLGLFVVDRLTDGVVFEVDDGCICATCWRHTSAHATTLAPPLSDHHLN